MRLSRRGHVKLGIFACRYSQDVGQPGLQYQSMVLLVMKQPGCGARLQPCADILSLIIVKRHPTQVRKGSKKQHRISKLVLGSRLLIACADPGYACDALRSHGVHVLLLAISMVYANATANTAIPAPSQYVHSDTYTGLLIKTVTSSDIHITTCQ